MQKIIHHTLKLSQVLRKVKDLVFSIKFVSQSQKFKVVPSQHNKVKFVVGRTFSNAKIYKWIKTQQLLALNLRNE